ncbi:hypothetical protein ACFO5K_04395 [Nocardia halotolerans]|uniref:Uncharacterized protein n=1 Tax=Nocardia halotolerans TaxID=1755878 RepID=A0ABV8VBM5_9NOCA
MGKTAISVAAGVVAVLTWWFVVPRFLGVFIAASAGISDTD